MSGKVGEETIKKVFKYYDKDGSGKISASELKSVMDEMGISMNATQIKEALDSYDLNKDGEWDYSEFYNFYVKVVMNTDKKLTSEQEVRGIFNLLDTDKNGKIDNKELAKFLEQIGTPIEPDMVSQLIEMYDENKNGALDFKEFEKFFNEAMNKTGAFS